MRRKKSRKRNPVPVTQTDKARRKFAQYREIVRCEVQ